MAKRNREPIQVKAFVKVNGVDTDVDELTPEQKRELGTWLKLTCLNELFRGQAVFSVKDGEEPGK